MRKDGALPKVVPRCGVPQLPAYLLPDAPILDLPLVPITLAVRGSWRAATWLDIAFLN